MYFSVDNFEKLDKFFRRNLINSVTGFKSLNLVGTQNLEKLTNLAPFSQVFHIGASPAYIGLLIRPDSVTRHTLENIEATQFYTFNHVLSTFYKQAHQSSARYSVSEFEATGLTPEYSDLIPAPYVKEAHIKIGMKLEERVDIRLNGTILLIGSIQEMFIPDDCVGEDGMIDLEKAGTITCSGLDSYHTTQKLSRLSYAKVDRELFDI